MRSAQAKPPKSTKVETLPPELREIADKMLKQKFNLKEEHEPKVEGEVLESFSNGVRGTPPMSYKMVVYNARPVGRSVYWELKKRNRGVLNSLQHSQLGYANQLDNSQPREHRIEFSCDPNEDPVTIAQRLRIETDRLERDTGYRYELTRLA